MRKINITSSLLFDKFFKEEEIETIGIRKINEDRIKDALKSGKTIKLIGYGDKNGKIYVRPEELEKNSILGSLKGGENAIVFYRKCWRNCHKGHGSRRQRNCLLFS